MGVVEQTSSSTPAAIDLAILKLHCRIDTTALDSYLSDQVIPAASDHVEDYWNRVLTTRTFAEYLDEFPAAVILLSRNPVVSVSSIVYIDSNGAQQTFAAASYVVDVKSAPARIALASGAAWPSTQSERPNAVTITYTAGHGLTPSDVPPKARQAVYMLAAWFYRHPEAALIGPVSKEIEFGVKALLGTRRLVRVG